MKRGIKHGHLPGDISKLAKIELLEGTTGWSREQPARRTSYKKLILMKERAVLTRRFRKMVDSL
jgi:hypothetical protein